MNTYVQQGYISDITDIEFSLLLVGTGIIERTHFYS